MAREPSILSISIAHTTAVGHFNAGLDLYRQFEATPNEQRAPDTGLDPQKGLELAIPAVTNLALGLELFFKVHHFQTTGNYPFGHDIQKLGSTLPDHAIQSLRAIYKEMYDDPNSYKGVEFRFAGGSTGNKQKKWSPVDSSTYDAAIAYVGPMYVRWRYIYEEFQEEIDIGVSFAPLYFLSAALHRAIREHRGNTTVTMNYGPAPENEP